MFVNRGFEVVVSINASVVEFACVEEQRSSMAHYFHIVTHFTNPIVVVFSSGSAETPRRVMCLC